MRNALILFLLPAQVLAAAAAPTLDTDPQLVGWWKFDETEGVKAADSTPNGRTGELKGGLSFEKNSIPGRAGKALAFGGGGCVQVTGYKGVTGTAKRTVMAWIKTKRPEGQIVSWGFNDAGNMWILGFIRGRVGVTPKGGYLYMNAETNDDKWHHVAIVLEEAELPNLHDHAKLYKDGEPAEIHDIGLLDLWPINTGKELDVKIGSGYEGAIDDLRIYDRSLTEKEIKALFELRSNQTEVKGGKQ